MKRILILLGLLFAVPVLGLWAADYVQSDNNQQLQQVLREQFPEVPAENFSGATVDILCSERSPGIDEICTTNDYLNLMRTASWWAIGVGLSLLLLIKLAGIVANNNRTLLLWIFKPGLYLTAISLVGLVLTHAVLAMGVIYYGESAVIGQVHIGIIAAVGIGALLGAYVIIRNTFAILHKVTSQAIGMSLTRQEAPRLWEAINDTARRLGSLVPDHAVVGLEPNFFVTEANVMCLNGTLTGRTLYCSLPLARIMCKDEFISVLGHELGHFKGEDTKFSAKFYPIYRGANASLQALGEVSGEGAGGVALLPAIAVFGYFLDSFSRAESKIGRDRELAADNAGASVATPKAIGSALVKLHAFSGIWNDLQIEALDRLRDGKYFINASMLFAERASERAVPAFLEGITATHLSHPTDSHPPLATRLHALGLTLAELQSDALSVQPADAALDLFDHVEALEEELSERVQLYLAHAYNISIPCTTTEGDAS